jgi:hypothetical protein
MHSLLLWCCSDCGRWVTWSGVLMHASWKWWCCCYPRDNSSFNKFSTPFVSNTTYCRRETSYNIPPSVIIPARNSGQIYLHSKNHVEQQQRQVQQQWNAGLWARTAQPFLRRSGIPPDLQPDVYVYVFFLLLPVSVVSDGRVSAAGRRRRGQT